MLQCSAGAHGWEAKGESGHLDRQYSGAWSVAVEMAELALHQQKSMGCNRRACSLQRLLPLVVFAEGCVSPGHLEVVQLWPRSLLLMGQSLPHCSVSN